MRDWILIRLIMFRKLKLLDPLSEKYHKATPKKFLVLQIFQTKIGGERIFFFFYENDEANFFLPQKELVFIGCVQYIYMYMIS